MSARRTPPDVRTRTAQRGASMLALMAIMGVAIFLGLFAMKVGPAYFENMTINNIVKDKAADAELMKSPKSRVYAAIDTAYRTNNLWDMKAEDTIRLKRDGERGYVVTVAYEKRSNLFGNIDVVTVFDKEATP